MNLSILSYQQIIETIETICEEYGDFIALDCAEEITEKFYEYWDSSFSGMNKKEAYFYNSVIESIVALKIQELILIESE